MKNVRVRQVHGKNGPVKNHFIINTPEATCFQSYDTIIVKTIAGNSDNNYKRQVFLDRDKWDYSKTTGKYRNLFLGETKKETEKKIKSGEYQLVDLNN